MGTIIDLTIERITLDWSKNSVGIDHGCLFQHGDRARRRAEEINYNWYAQNPEEDFGPSEAASVRPLARVLPRLNLLGQTLHTARAEYNAAVVQALETAEIVDASSSPPTFMTFEEFCDFCRRHPLSSLSSTYVAQDRANRDLLAQGRFAAIADEIARIPSEGVGGDMYWSEASFFGAKVFY